MSGRAQARFGMTKAVQFSENRSYKFVDKKSENGKIEVALFRIENIPMRNISLDLFMEGKPAMASDELLHETMHSFRRVTGALFDLLREEAQKEGVTAVQLLVLRSLHKHPDATLGCLAQELLLSNSTVSGVIDRLVDAGLVQRSRAEGDRRQLAVSLTEEGARIQKQAFSPSSSLMRKLHRILDIPEEELRHLLRIHDAILNQIRG